MGVKVVVSVAVGVDVGIQKANLGSSSDVQEAMTPRVRTVIAAMIQR